MKSEQCLSIKKQEDNSLKVSTWLAADDIQQEGVWTNWYTGEAVTHLPWAKNRPYRGGVTYNCMQLQLNIVDTGDTFGDIQNGLIRDEECENDAYCPICSIGQPILKVYVRGLCKNSLFNNMYTYNIDSKGDILYLGQKTSMITYDMMSQQWVWYDNKDNMSVATSNSSYASLLIGVHTVDFSGVVDDKCQDQEGVVVRSMKFTTCTYGQFTCSDGLCINIEERCDQIEHCNDNQMNKLSHYSHREQIQ